ncbi:PucR family transcriptional regulator [Streptomyces sp. NPDC048172]|uniref:PucR family transcriptional regulator n=1 Tax=Streptomyces sp. NPDC048172 TaxID=3365505 RepID=UPI0037116A85
MCELRADLPAVADQMVDALRHSLPALSAVLRESGREDARGAIEQVLTTALATQPGVAPGGHDDEETVVRAEEGTPSIRAVPAVSGASDAPSAERARRMLFAALTADRAPGAAASWFDALARSARWPLPSAVRAVVLAAPCESPPLTGPLASALAGPVEGEPCLLVPDPRGEAREALDGHLQGWTAAVGHAVALEDCADSVRWARRLLELAPVHAVNGSGSGSSSGSGSGSGSGAGPGAVFVDDHLTTLLLLQDESMARALTARWLGPLAELTPRQSERLEVTLLAWLESGGAPEAARTLQVHPQTVRYRLRQIEKVFGAALRDPRARFELEAALRGRQLLGRVRRGRARTGGRKARAGGAAGPGAGPAQAQEARINGL